MILWYSLLSSKAKYLNLLDDEDNQRDLNSEESGSVNKKLNNTKGFSVRKILSLSGTSCFGTYCNFDQRAKVNLIYHIIVDYRRISKNTLITYYMIKTNLCKECCHG